MRTSTKKKQLLFKKKEKQWWSTSAKCFSRRATDKLFTTTNTRTISLCLFPPLVVAHLQILGTPQTPPCNTHSRKRRRRVCRVFSFLCRSAGVHERVARINPHAPTFSRPMSQSFQVVCAPRVDDLMQRIDIVSEVLLLK